MHKKLSLKQLLLALGGVVVVCVVLIVVFGGGSEKTEDATATQVQSNNQEQSANSAVADVATEQQTVKTLSDEGVQKSYEVVKVVDGDTIDVSINGKVERVRLIGINTPETVDPRKPVECFGVEASNKAKSLLTGKKVVLEDDASQGERDKYGRLLRYVFLEDGTNFNLLMIRDGYAYEYTYNLPYKYQAEFKKAQKEAEVNRGGLWGDLCQGKTTLQTSGTVVSTTTQTGGTQSACTIKGNINSNGEKIYHVIGCGSYNQTKIDEGAGERWFCWSRKLFLLVGARH